MHSAHATVDRALQSQREKMVTVLQRQRQKSLKRAVFQVLQQRMQVGETSMFKSAWLKVQPCVSRCLPFIAKQPDVCIFSGMHPVA